MLEPNNETEIPPLNKAPSLLVLLHHHDTQLSRLQIVPSRAPIVEQLLYLSAESLAGTRRRWLHSILTQGTVLLCLSTIKLEQPIMGIKASAAVILANPTTTNFDQDWALLDLTKSIVAMTRQDSDLEAFSHNPTDGSFTALAVQLTVFTNYPIQGFLSY